MSCSAGNTPPQTKYDSSKGASFKLIFSFLTTFSNRGSSAIYRIGSEILISRSLIFIEDERSGVCEVLAHPAIKNAIVKKILSSYMPL